VVEANKDFENNRIPSRGKTGTGIFSLPVPLFQELRKTRHCEQNAAIPNSIPINSCCLLPFFAFSFP
jgi:hypothetical protein